MELTIADGLLALLVNAPTPALLQHAKSSTSWLARCSGGIVEVLDHTCELSLTSLGGGWCAYYHCVVQMRGGAFDGLRVAGVASNRKLREAGAHLALAAACLAREGGSDLEGYAQGMDNMVNRVSVLPGFTEFYGGWPRDVPREAQSLACVDDWDSGEEPTPYRNADLRAYSETLSELTKMEWDAAHGEREDEIVNIAKSVQRGSTIVDAHVALATGDDGFEVRWDRGEAQRMRVGTKLLASRTDPADDAHKHVAVIRRRPHARLLLLESEWHAPTVVTFLKAAGDSTCQWTERLSRECCAQWNRWLAGRLVHCRGFCARMWGVRMDARL